MHLIAKRTPALEWAFWDALTKSTKPIDPKALDQEKLTALSQHPELIKQLDKWILSPDKGLLPALMRLAEIVNLLYGFTDLVLYRGFDASISYQDTMGLTSKCAVGEHHTYDLPNPLSFSTERSIAQSFSGGKVVVQTIINPHHVHALVVTDELSFLVSELRNIDPETQKEVIVFPPASIKFTILEK